MVYLTSDTHGAFDIHKINPDEFIPGRTMTDKDCLLICGDFGCLWDGGSSDRFWLNWLESLPWITLFIDGNHENFDVINSYPVEEWHGGLVHRIRSNIFHLMRGEIYDIDGKTWLCIGGAFSHDVEWRVPGKTWWSEEIVSREEVKRTFENLEKHNWEVDYIVSHDVYSSHPFASRYFNDMSLYDEDRINQQEFLEEVRRKTKYKMWFSGHYHEDALFIEDGRPCYTLFDTVDTPENLAASPERFRNLNQKS